MMSVKSGLLVAVGAMAYVGGAELATGRFSRPMPAETNVKPTNPALAEMASDFRDPFGKVRTGCYWYWINGNVACEGVRKDLEAMKRVGIDRAYIGDIGNQAGTPGPVKTFSPAWEKAYATAFETASRLGIQIGLFNSPGWSQSGGPWVTHDKAMRRLACNETTVVGPKAGPLALPVPDLFDMPSNEWQNVAVVAYPTPAGTAARLTRTGTFAANADGKVVLDFDSPESFEAQSVCLMPNPGRFAGTVTVEALTGGTFTKVYESAYGRTNPSRGVGFLPQAPVLGTFAPVRATKFRVTVSGHRNASFASVELCAAPGIEKAFEKSFAKMFETPYPTWRSYLWPQEAAERPGSSYDPSKAVVLTDRLKPDGRLDWNVPDGTWTIVRVVMTPTGSKNVPANPEATGYEVDKMSRTHIAGHVESYLGKILDRTPPEHRKAITHAVMDSYETGGQNATDDLVERFKASFGYDPTPYLPTAYGLSVGSRDDSDRFLWDLRRFVADEVAYSYVAGLRDASNRRGLKTWLEPYGHWGYPGEFLQYGGQSNEIGGEYWSSGALGNIENRAASSCGHIYGKNLIWCESNTSGGLTLYRTPMDLKTRTDRFFAEGINASVIHLYIHQPDERQPGIVASFGYEFNRHNTWFDHLDLFIGYLKRCGYLLRQGLNVADVAYFIGEDAPIMTGSTEPAPPKGRQFDFINAEVLCETAGVDAKGRLVLPHGTTYEVLVLPPLKTMRPKMLERIETLVKAGAFVLGPKPERSPSLSGQPASDARVREIADRLWGEVDGKTVKSARRGKGTIASGLSIDEALAMRRSEADVIHDGSLPLSFGHRTMPNADIYFLTALDGKAVPSTEISFRATGRVPELWDAATGEIRPVESWRVEGTRTVVRMSLAERESMFVVFAKDAGGRASGRGPSASGTTEVAGPWTAAFQSDALHRGPKDPVRLDRLCDLSTSSDAAIKYYSGKVVYRTSFEGRAAKPGERLTLSLGDVAVTAKVKVNGREAGGVCFAPYKLDVTDFVKDGANVLEVEVCNLWVNRLVGDDGLKDRPTWTSMPVRYQKMVPVKSGLVGPVRIIRL